VIAGPASSDLAAKIANRLRCQLVVADLRIFADGESKVRIGKTAVNCVIVQSTYPPADTHLMQAMMLTRKCADDGARDVCAVIPYLAYARQDKAFLEGESISISLVARLFEAAGIKHLITVDIHSQLVTSHFSSVSIQNISSLPILAEYARSMRLENPIAVSPDAGGAERVGEFARVLQCGFLVLKKSRNRNTGEVTVDGNFQTDIKGRDAILVDDMISTGGSIVSAAEVLQQHGASKVYAVCGHALMIGDAAKMIRAAGVRDIVATNSIPNEFAKVDLSEAIAAALKSRYSP